MTTRPALALVASVLLLAGCGGSSSSSRSSATSAPTSASLGAASASPSGAAGSTATTGADGQSGQASGASAAPAGTGAAAPAQPGGTATGGSSTATGSSSTAPGAYTYDISGTVTVGTAQDASGTATLTVDRPAGARQHSVLKSDRDRTEQDVVVRTNGTYLVRLSITNPAFSKEFRPAAPVLLVPDPADPGRSWSWTATSTDGKTTVQVSARIARRETLTIGGVRTPTSVVTSTLKLTGDVTYTGRMETWYDAAHRLSVKEHTRGEGTFGGVAFTTDVTSVLRSTRPA